MAAFITAAALVLGAGGLASPSGAAPAGGGLACDFYLYDLDLYLICLGGNDLTADPSEACYNDTVTITVTGWLPNSTVDVSVEAGGQTFVVGGIQVDGTGTGQTTWLVPPGTPVGPATVIAVGIDFLEQPSERTRAIAICDTAPPSTPTTADGGDGTGQQGTLPRTGSDSGRLVGLAAALIVIGAAAVYGATRGRRQGSEV